MPIMRDAGILDLVERGFPAPIIIVIAGGYGRDINARCECIDHAIPDIGWHTTIAQSIGAAQIDLELALHAAWRVSAPRAARHTWAGLRQCCVVPGQIRILVKSLNIGSQQCVLPDRYLIDPSDETFG